MNRLRRWLIYKLGGVVLQDPLNPKIEITQRKFAVYEAKIIVPQNIPEEVAKQELYRKASEILPQISEIKKDIAPYDNAYEYTLRIFVVPKGE